MCEKWCYNQKYYIDIYDLNLPPNVVNNIVEYSCCENRCSKCECRQHTKEWICRYTDKFQAKLNRQLEDDLLIFIMVYGDLHPPLEYVRTCFRVSEKQYGGFKHLLWVYAARSEKDAIEDANDYMIETYELTIYTNIS